MIEVLRAAKLNTVLTFPYNLVPIGNNLHIAVNDGCVIVGAVIVSALYKTPYFHIAVKRIPLFSTCIANISLIIFTNFAPKPFRPDASLFISASY